MAIYIVISSIIFGLLGLIWDKSDWPNLLIKVLFIALTIWGIRLVWFIPYNQFF